MVQKRAAPAIWFAFPELCSRNALNLSCTDLALFHARPTEKTGTITKRHTKTSGCLVFQVFPRPFEKATNRE